MSELTHHPEAPAFEDIRLSADAIGIRKITLDDLKESLRKGLDDFHAKPGAFPLLMLFFPFFVLLFTLFSLGGELRYLAFPVVAGFTLIGPLFAVVFFQMSRAREQGKEMRWLNLFSFIHTHSFAPLLALSLIMMLLYVSWVYMAEFLYFGIFGDESFGSMSGFISEVLTTRRGWALISYGNLLGFLFAYAAMAISVVSFPLVLDKPVTSMTAAKVSIRAFTGNFAVLAVWGILVAVLMALGAALFLLGLAFVLPVLGHATWHLYRRLVE